MLKTNGKKSYRVTTADAVTKLMMEEYEPKFFQFFDEENELVELDNHEDNYILTYDEVESMGWYFTPCSWRTGGSRKLKATGEIIPFSASFSAGAAEGQGSLKLLSKSTLPTFLKKPAMNWFNAAVHDLNLSSPSDTLVGAIDSSRNMTEEKYYELLSIMKDYVTYPGSKNYVRIKEEELKNILNLLHDKVLKHTHIYKSISI